MYRSQNHHLEEGEKTRRIMNKQEKTNLLRFTVMNKNYMFHTPETNKKMSFIRLTMRDSGSYKFVSGERVRTIYKERSMK